ncbi:MAG: HAMP domain-containing histidine kinase [Oscillospiraceae bacterium]|nr:HAMP domain-containing histidine kinase [Oscillospiraceae bacterium]
MRRTKSIFFKYFYICSAVILTSFICLGAVLLLVSSQYFTGEKRDLLTTNLQKALTEARLVFQEGAEDITLEQRLENVSNVLKNYSAASNADFYITHDNGEIVATGEVLRTSIKRDKSIPLSVLSEIGDEVTYIQSDLDGFFEEQHHNVAQHFYDIGHTSLYIIVSSPVSQQDASVKNMLKLFIISTVVVLIICVVVVYVATLRLTAPIKEMAQTAKKIGEGDFSSQLPEYEIMEFQELGHAINDMATSIASYDKMRTSFVANVSHELRTPMTSIGGFVDGIMDGTIPQNQHKKYLGIVSLEIKRLTRLVKSMLNLAKIESGSTKPEFKMINVVEPIANSLFTFEDRINAKNLDIRGLDVDRTMIYADNDLVHQVMYNLIENAIKFVNDNGYIEFGFEKIGDITEVSITNSGDGLSEEELPLVFDRFYKTDQSRGLDATGVGLGLNIVKSIVKLHGGTIRVTSVEGEYTKFIIQFKNTEES